jgi:proline dehydrogenase
VLRSVVLGVANRPAIKRAVTGGIGRKVALRFVAGEDLEHALEVIRSLNASGADVSIDHLGENVTDLTQAASAAGVYRAAIDHIRSDGLRANVSIKLTQMGLDVDQRAATSNVEALVAAAHAAGTSVTLDMEDHAYTDRTVDTCLRLARDHPGAVGIAVQAYLHRTPEDLKALIAAGVHVRLCKGAYREPRKISYRKRDDIDEAYARLANRLLASDAYAMIATHDERLVDHALRAINRLKRAPGTYEFQMLYGVRRELQRRLLKQGFALRVYVPFGSQWYPYLMRRIAERPANVRFFVESLVRK